MYNNPTGVTGAAVLPATGMGTFTSPWVGMAAFALIMLGFALIRMAGTFRKEDEPVEYEATEPLLDDTELVEEAQS